VKQERTFEIMFPDHRKSLVPIDAVGVAHPPFRA
jgi:hypothetical protein